MESPLSSQLPSARPFLNVKPFTPDGGASHLGSVMTLVFGVSAAAGLGFLASLIGQHLYLVILFPAVIGCGVGGAVAYGLNLGKVRDPWIGAAAGLLGGLVAMGTMHYFDYHHYVQTLNEEHPGSGRAFMKKVGFRGFMEMEARRGVTITSTHDSNGERGINLGYAGTILYWMAEVGIVLAIVVGMGRRGASKPFCVRCHEWKTEHVLRVLKTSPQVARSAIERGDVVALIHQDMLGGGLGEPCQLRAYVCPCCSSKGAVEIALVHETKNRKGQKQYEELVKITYPGAVVTALEAAVAGEKDATARSVL